MKALGGLLVLCIISGALLVMASGWAHGQMANSRLSERELVLAEGKSRAMVIEARADYAERMAYAESRSRMNAASANALMMVAAAPWGAMALLGCFGVGVIVLGLALILRRPTPVIERQVAYLPQPNQTRRELWMSLSQNALEVRRGDYDR